MMRAVLAALSVFFSYPVSVDLQTAHQTSPAHACSRFVGTRERQSYELFGASPSGG